MEQDLLQMGASALRKAALNEQAKDYILSNEILFRTLKKAADRYIGGETLEETIVKVKEQNKHGFKTSMEFMGENTNTEKEAAEASDEFIRIAQEIKKQSLNSTVSLDLSHIGLALSKDLCLNNLDLICQEAEKDNIEVTISAEKIEITDAVIDVYKTASQKYNNVSITLQAYLHRSKDDFEDLIQQNGRIRMVKGAFETPQGISIPRGAALDERYLYYVDQLLSRNHSCAIATHHDLIQKEVVAMLENYKTSKDLYEFESLYGIQNEQLARLKEQGYPAKLYFVYGKEWYLYLCNRIAEYPLNIFQALNDIVS
ncbi:proline dehydrogenase [Flavobacterium aquidurense]|uniref:proline dehydrogenase family protein n=1 Tax=Flavobacterium aquidurense TaxID=362413 RepID=UPI000922E013|nr:proline dehydrogenase family protein [Flavobacterium aquidurense]OXA70865.1 proline dehydrogenase [Flavobacterium aquidurense]SHF97209.1 L-proline dehydrogenase [Flavobacterium frigidimaris]